MGRKLFVRVHLAAYILQKVYDLTDRQVEYGLNDNAAYQLFSGKGIAAHPAQVEFDTADPAVDPVSDLTTRLTLGWDKPEWQRFY